MKKIDCLGDICPIPIIKTKKELQQMASGETVMIATDHSCTFQNLMDLLAGYDVQVESEEVINGVWEIHVTKN